MTLFFSSGLPFELGALRPLPVSPAQTPRAGGPQNSRQTLEQQLHRGKTEVELALHHTVTGNGCEAQAGNDELEKDNYCLVT